MHSGPIAGSLMMQESGPAEPLQRRPPAYYQYELKGVVVHSGTAFAGHYYSYIKVRTVGLKSMWSPLGVLGIVNNSHRVWVPIAHVTQSQKQSTCQS